MRTTERQPAPRPPEAVSASRSQDAGSEAHRRFQHALRRAEQGREPEPTDDGVDPDRSPLGAMAAAQTRAPAPQPDPEAARRGDLPRMTAAAPPTRPLRAAPADAPADDVASPRPAESALATSCGLPFTATAFQGGVTPPDAAPPAPPAPPSATWLALQRSAQASEGPSAQWRLLLPDGAGPAQAVALQRSAGGRLGVQVQPTATTSPEALERLRGRLARHAAHLDDGPQEEAQP